MERNFFVAIGGGDEIGASSYLLHVGKTNLLIDAGLRFHSRRIFPDFSILGELIGGVKELDAFLLTHAHLDHCGALTRLFYEAPHLGYYSTSPTIDLTRIILSDSLRISSRKSGEEWHITEFTSNLLDECLERIVPIEFSEETWLNEENVRLTAFPAGHVLGAASFLIEVGGLRIFHTGDISLHSQRMIPGFNLQNCPDQVDVLIIESTYAHQASDLERNYEEQQFQLVNDISAVIRAGGRVLIPAFALGRAQEIIGLFTDYFDQGLIEPFPVRIEGLINQISEAYNHHRSFLQGRKKVRSGHALYSSFVYPIDAGSVPERRAIDSLLPTCVIASSGMLLDYTRSARYAEAFLPNPEDAIFFSGQVDIESPGKRLSGLSNARFRINHTDVDVRAKIGQFNLSAHAPSIDLRKIIDKINPRKLILIHGQHRSGNSNAFEDYLSGKKSRGMQTYQSQNGIPIYL